METVQGKKATIHPKTVYRLLAFTGTITLTVACFLIVNIPVIRLSFDKYLITLGGPSTQPATSTEPRLTLAVLVAVTVIGVLPLCKPQSRRILDTIITALRSLLIVALFLATIGYFGFSFRLPQTTLVLLVGCLSVALPLWFVGLQQLQLKRTDGTLIVGTDPNQIEAAIQATTKPIVGYTYTSTHSSEDGRETQLSTDGGTEKTAPKLAKFERVGELSVLDEILKQSNVGTVVPALPQTDRAEFFGILEACHRHDVSVEILDEHNESVLVKEEQAVAAENRSNLVGINLQPWDLQNRVCKRLFDLVFAGLGLLCTLPLLIGIAIAVKVDSPGPVFYTQERTTQFGETFQVYKFRSMIPESESAVPGEDHDRITRFGRLLRKTHLDELPQLWAIIIGQMSVVGPRAAWTAEEQLLQDEIQTWQKRWFVKPGLTGLAQINNASSETPRAKLQYDLTYIKNQSLWFDSKIVVRQLWMVFVDVISLLTSKMSSRP
ncbi:exopolysaccharide biosynthesis polyprenyl glycosylphosphotransferase [Natrinema sp. CBA1119]|nr:exopolysaccharide biosynthesis polyprenyl glycosylphosphotransferase [Natrinema sp. CBA1119]